MLLNVVKQLVTHTAHDGNEGIGTTGGDIALLTIRGEGRHIMRLEIMHILTGEHRYGSYLTIGIGSRESHIGVDL